MNTQRTMTVPEVLAAGDSLGAEPIQTEGRIQSVRAMKNIWFADIAYHGRVLQISAAHEIARACGAGDLVRVRGSAYRTKAGALTLGATAIERIAHWSAAAPYGQKNAIKRGPLFALAPDSFERLYWPQACITEIRDFLRSSGFMEVHTPTVLRRYNGGRSFPVMCTYLGEEIGFYRTTLEERMQALVASGFDRIFQMGNVFRSGGERILFEAYAANMDYDAGSALFVNLLSQVAGALQESGIGASTEHVRAVIDKRWRVLDYFAAAREVLGLERERIAEGGLALGEAAEAAGIAGAARMTPETLADSIADFLAARESGPVIIERYPLWSSPLYRRYEHEGIAKLQRARLYLPGDPSGAEMGVQENDPDDFRARVAAQRRSWNLPEDDGRTGASDLEELLEGGVPPMFGLATKIERLIGLWRSDYTIDPFNTI